MIENFSELLFGRFPFFSVHSFFEFRVFFCSRAFFHSFNHSSNKPLSVFFRAHFFLAMPHV